MNIKKETKIKDISHVPPYNIDDSVQKVFERGI